MMDTPDTASTLERLRALDTATLYESGAHATMGPEVRMLSGNCRLAGPALTVVCPPGDNLMIHIAVARARPGTVLVAQCHDPRFGVWGEVLTVAAMARDIAGLVLDGSVRDLGAIRRMGFPVFARGTALPGTTKRGPGVIGADTTCGGTLVKPGDIIVADESGIVLFRSNDAERVLAKAEERSRKETIIMKELQSGRTTIDLLGLDERSAGN
jgi:4-hydroxy-4-methyl-2-oxoglutarate aldolase